MSEQLHTPTQPLAQCASCGLWIKTPHGSDAACIAALREVIETQHGSNIAPTATGGSAPDVGLRGPQE